MVCTHLGSPWRDPVTMNRDAGAFEVSFLPVIKTGTLDEIFRSLGVPLEGLAYFPAEIKAFEREHHSVLMDPGNATLMLQFLPEGRCSVAALWSDGVLDMPLESEEDWPVGEDHVHQVVVPSSILNLILARSQPAAA